MMGSSQLWQVHTVVPGLSSRRVVWRNRADEADQNGTRSGRHTSGLMCILC